MASSQSGTLDTVAFISGSILAEEVFESALTKVVGKSAGSAMMIVQALLMLVDHIDPYGYGFTYTRDAVDGMSTAGVQALENIFASPAIQANIRTRVALAYPTLPTESLDKIVALQTQTYNLFERPFQDLQCYGNAVSIPTASSTTSLGAPTDACDPTYLAAYREYVAANEARYVEEEITDSREMAATLNGLARGSIRLQLKARRNAYQAVFWGGLGAVALFASAPLWWASARPR